MLRFLTTFMNWPPQKRSSEKIMTDMEPIELAKIYCGCMEEIKARVNIILTFNEGKITTGSDVTDVEFICLQFRKVLELIALSSIAPNKEEYSKQREKFHKDWHANRILKELERINPDFYPCPIKQAAALTESVKHFEEMGENYLKREEFENIYDHLGGLLHANNPFGQKKDFAHTRKQFGEWTTKIINLLNFHSVKIINLAQVWLVVMSDPADSKVHTYIGEAADKFLIK